MEQKKRKLVHPSLLIFAVFALFALFLVCFSFVGVKDVGRIYHGRCVSVALFGKLEAVGIDKVVISAGDRSITVTDMEMVNEIVDATKVATSGINTECDCSRWNRRIDWYRSGKLVRSMEWISYNHVKVYDVDYLHWVLHFERGEPISHASAGYARLPKDLADKLCDLLEKE